MNYLMSLFDFPIFAEKFCSNIPILLFRSKMSSGGTYPGIPNYASNELCDGFSRFQYPTWQLGGNRTAYQAPISVLFSFTFSFQNHNLCAEVL